MAVRLFFAQSLEATLLCALEVGEALKSHPKLRSEWELQWSGQRSDRPERAPNIAGAGINMAQRVMDCGDAGHILLSEHVAEDLGHYPQWQPGLDD